MVVVVTMNEDNSNLAPRQPAGEAADWALATGAPEEFGFREVIPHPYFALSEHIGTKSLPECLLVAVVMLVAFVIKSALAICRPDC